MEEGNEIYEETPGRRGDLPRIKLAARYIDARVGTFKFSWGRIEREAYRTGIQKDDTTAVS